MIIEGIYINVDICTRTQQQALYVATSLGSRHGRDACMEHCPPTSEPPEDPMDRLVGKGARGAAAAVCVQPKLILYFLLAVWSV